jgi:hypothetical protein
MALSKDAKRRRQVAKQAAVNHLKFTSVARHWMSLSLEDLGGRRPNDVAPESEEGLQRVLQLLTPPNPDGFYFQTGSELETFLANADRVPRIAADRAPEAFDPGRVPAGSPIVEYWWVKDFPGYGCQALKGLVLGHPHLGHDAEFRSSALIWYDEGLGFARAQTRFYRLGTPAPYPSDNGL